MTVWQRWVRQPQTVWLRRAVFQVHLWSGTGVGLYIVVISLSGAVLVYRSELRQTFDPQPLVVAVAGDRLSAEALTEAAQASYPDDSVSIFFDPEDPTLAATISVNRDGVVQQMFFDPYTGEDLGHALPLGWRLTTWLLDLHDNLLYGDTGRAVNGVGALLMTLLSVTGAFCLVARYSELAPEPDRRLASQLETDELESPQFVRDLDRRVRLAVGGDRNLSVVSAAFHGDGRLPRAARPGNVRAASWRCGSILAVGSSLRTVWRVDDEAAVGLRRPDPSDDVRDRPADVVESRPQASGPVTYGYGWQLTYWVGQTTPWCPLGTFPIPL